MTSVKSFSVGNGDMFYIRHCSDNFTLIDCCLPEERQDEIVEEIESKRSGKNVTRFISTHPDEDHILGLDYLDDELGLRNFYCVKNGATKSDKTDAFRRYVRLRDSDKAFYIFRDCKRRWMNESSDERGSAGISILWPKTSNGDYQLALEQAAAGESPNNISPIVEYSLKDGPSFIWMGDLESDFMENICKSIRLPATPIVFAPHHGRDSGKIPQQWLDQLAPKVVVIGEAPSRSLNYYRGYDTITQNSAGDIRFDCSDKDVHIYVSSDTYSVSFLTNLDKPYSDGHYIGTLQV